MDRLPFFPSGHAAVVSTRWLRGQQMYRYDCQCGKAGKYKKWSNEVWRGYNAHVTALRIKGGERVR